MANRQTRTVTVGEYIAEELEAEANRLPRSHEEQADILRRSAAIMRKQGSRKQVRIWEDTAQTT